MSFEIRTARVDDAAAIAMVQVESWRTTYRGIVPDAVLDEMNVEERTAQWAKQLGGSGLLMYVAYDAQGVFGFVCGGPLREAVKEYSAELYAIYLLQSRQRSGVGREMARKLSAELLKCEFQSMLVWVLEQNPSVAFYERLGGVREASKTITLGGKELQEIAFGWPLLEALLSLA